MTRELKENNISKKDRAVLWSIFISNPKGVGEKEMSENEDIKKAKEELEKINEDKREQYLAHLRLKHILDTKDIELYGYNRGKAEGIKEKQKEVIMNMHKKNMNIELICEILNLSQEEVKEVISNS